MSFEVAIGKNELDDKIILRVYSGKDAYKIKGDLYNFLIELNEEKETFLMKYITDLEYSKTIRKLIDTTIFVTIAWMDNHIVGVDGINRKKVGTLSNIWPVVRGYTAVNKAYQGRGIGTLLSRERNKILEKIPVFHEEIIKKNNTRMLKINKNLHYKFIFEDDEVVYFLKTYNRLLSLFSSIFILLYSFAYRATSTQRRVKLFFTSDNVRA